MARAGAALIESRRPAAIARMLALADALRACFSNARGGQEQEPADDSAASSAGLPLPAEARGTTTTAAHHDHRKQEAPGEPQSQWGDEPSPHSTPGGVVKGEPRRHLSVDVPRNAGLPPIMRVRSRNSRVSPLSPASVLPIGLDSGISPRQPSARKLSLLGPRPSSGPGGLQCLPVTRAPSYAVPTSCTSVQRDDSEARASPWSASAGCALDSSAFFTGTPGGSSFLRALTPSELLLVTASHSRVSSSSGVAPHDQRLFAAVCHAAAAHSDAHGGGGPDCRSAQSSPSAARTSRGSAAAAATRVAAATLWSALSAQPSPPHVLHGVAGVQLHKQMPSGAVAGPSPSPPGAPTAFHPVDEACIWSPSHGPHGGEAASGALSPQQQWRRIDTWDHSAAADAGPSLLQRSSILGAAGGTAAGGGGAQTEKDATVMQLLSNIRQRRRIMHQQQQQQWCAARSATRGHAKRSASMTLLQVRPSTTATLRQHAAASQSATGADSPSDDAGGRPGSGGPGGINCPVSDQEAPVGNRSFTRWASLGAQRQAGGDRPSTSGLGAQPVARVARVRTSSDLRPAHLVCGEADGGGGAEELVAGAISALSAFVGRSGGSTGAVFMEPAPRGSALGDVGAVGAAQGAAPPSDSLPQRVPSVSAR